MSSRSFVNKKRCSRPLINKEGLASPFGGPLALWLRHRGGGMVGSIGALAACAVLALTPHHLAAPPTASLRPPPPCRTATAAMSLDSAAKRAGSGGAAGGDGADPTLAELWSLPTDEARRDAVTEMVRGWSGDGSKGEASRPFGFPPSWFPAHCVSRPLCFPRSTTPLSPCATDSLLIFLARSLTKGVVFGWAQRAARAEEFLGRLGEVRECSHTQFSVFPFFWRRGVPWEAGRGERVLTHPIFRLPPPHLSDPMSPPHVSHARCLF